MDDPLPSLPKIGTDLRHPETQLQTEAGVPAGADHEGKAPSSGTKTDCLPGRSVNNRAETQSIRIVIVDEQQLMIWGLQKLVESAAPRMLVVATATSLSAAFKAIGEQRPDVVLFDPLLVEGQGLNIVSGIAELGSKVILLTGAHTPDILDYAMVAGASGVVRKSEPAAILLRAIECVFKGELWLDRKTTARVFASLRNASRGPQPPHQALTPAERRILAIVTQHRSAPNKVVASALNISTNTLRNHLASIYGKLGLKRRLDVVLYAIRWLKRKNAPSHKSKWRAGRAAEGSSKRQHRHHTIPLNLEVNQIGICA
jgi:DNA-binding NarL/FixJ family response regulator